MAIAKMCPGKKGFGKKQAKADSLNQNQRKTFTNYKTMTKSSLFEITKLSVI